LVKFFATFEDYLHRLRNGVYKDNNFTMSLPAFKPTF